MWSSKLGGLGVIGKAAAKFMAIPTSLFYLEEIFGPTCRISETVSSLVLKLGLHFVVGWISFSLVNQTFHL